MKNRARGSLSLVALAWLSLASPPLVQADETILVPEELIDFRPASGSSYNIEWPGPPRKPLSYPDVKLYIPSLTLGKSAETSYTSKIKIMVHRNWWWDKAIGEFEALYTAGNTTPTVIRYASALPGSVAPVNAPAETQGMFWLGCTQLGRVKGNLAHHGSDAVVYLKEDDRALPGNTTVLGRGSPRHSVRCGDFATSGSSGTGSHPPDDGGSNRPDDPEVPPGRHPL